MTTKLEDYDVLEFIGKGSFASCYKIRNKHTTEVLVWKVIDYGELPEDKKQLLVTEVSLLRDLRHPHIVRYHDRIICKDSKRLYIILEFCPGGDLATLIKTCQRGLSFVDENFVWRVLHQLSSALHACHSWLLSSVVLHRDIKPANVFLDETGNAKLGDFGLACKLDIGQKGCVETMVGTPFYMSPEVMKGEMYNSKSDVWSLGCLVYELCALMPPFNAENIKQLASKISKGRFPRIPSHYSESLQSILSNLIVVDQDQRPSIYDVICHPVILSHLHESSEPIGSNGSSSILLSPELSCKHPPSVLVERDPQEVSKDTFQSEWMARLQALRDREAALRCREQQLNEKEHAILKREHRVVLMERMVRDKMILAEVYLKRSREPRQHFGTSVNLPGRVCRQELHISEEMDESFSADPGDTSVTPTSVLLDPAQLPKPLSLVRGPLPRRVHFSDNQSPHSTTVPSSRSKPLFLKVAEAIRSNKFKQNVQSKPIMQQKVLHFPGYTGPALTVNVPSNEIQDSNLIGSPSVELTVLFDDREDLKKATNNYQEEQISHNVESNIKLRGFNSKHSVNPSDNHKQVSEQLKDTIIKKVGSSVDPISDATEDRQLHSTSKLSKSVLGTHNLHSAESSLKKYSFGGSLRNNRKSKSINSNSNVSANVKCRTRGQIFEINDKSNATKDYQKHESGVAQKMCYKGKENMENRTGPSIQSCVKSVETTNSSTKLGGHTSHTLFLR